MSEHVVILGAGIAGVTACEEILKEAPDAAVTLLSDERDLPYVRPLLSKLALNTFLRDRLPLHTADWYENRGVRLLCGTAADRILTDKKEVLLADDTALAYDSCIYALGARSHVPPIPGANLPGTAVVRSIDDLQKIRRLLAAARTAVVIGGGVIGLEFAWEIKKSGCAVTVLEALPQLLPRVLDAQSAAVLEERAAAAGISVQTGVRIARIAGGTRAEAVVLADGRRFPADAVLLCCGVRANTAVAERSGLACGRGVLTDDTLRTSAPDVYAAGDCIQIDRSERHDALGQCDTDDLNPGLWTYAAESGRVAGYNAVHGKNGAVVFAPKPAAVLLSALGTNVFSMGDVREEACDRTLCGSQPACSAAFLVNPHTGADRCYEKRFYRGGRLCGAVLIGDLTAMPAIRQELEAGQATDPAKQACKTPEVTR